MDRWVLRAPRETLWVLQVEEEYYERTCGQEHDKYKHVKSTKYKKDKYGEIRQIFWVGRSSTCMPAKDHD